MWVQRVNVRKRIQMANLVSWTRHYLWAKVMSLYHWRVTPTGLTLPVKELLWWRYLVPWLWLPVRRRSPARWWSRTGASHAAQRGNGDKALRGPCSSLHTPVQQWFLRYASQLYHPDKWILNIIVFVLKFKPRFWFLFIKFTNKCTTTILNYR